MPKIDDGSADSGPGRPLKSAWITLNIAEGQELLESLKIWAEDLAEDNLDPQWHTHITGTDGNELTLAITPDEA